MSDTRRAQAGAVRLTVEPGGRGRQHGVLRLAVPRAADRHAVEELPLALLAGGPAGAPATGKSVALIAGPDEPAATAALGGLARDIDPAALDGRVLIVPRLGHGSAAALVHTLLEDAALVVLLGGEDRRSRAWCDAALLGCAPGERRGTARGEAAMVAFGAAHSLRLREDRGSGRDRGAAPPAIDPDAGWPDLCLDDSDLFRRPGDARPSGHSTPQDPLGQLATLLERRTRADTLEVRGHDGAGAADLDALTVGCRNVLVSLGMLDAPFTLRASRQLQACVARDLVRAPRAGLLAMRATAGQEVHAGDALADLLDTSAPLRAPTTVRATRAGTLAFAHRGGPLAAGEAIALLAEEMQA